MPQLIDLAPGKYQVEATFQGITKRQEILIESNKTSAVVLVLQSVTVEPLVIEIVASQVQGEAPLTVDFQGNLLSGDEPASYEWEFGDGGSGTGRIVFHTYLNPGAFLAVLKVTDAAGQEATQELGINVLSPPEPPPGPKFGDISITAVDAEALADSVLTSAIFNNRTDNELTIEFLIELIRQDGLVFRSLKSGTILSPRESMPLGHRFLSLPQDVSGQNLTVRWSGKDPTTGELLADQEEVQVFVSF